MLYFLLTFISIKPNTTSVINTNKSNKYFFSVIHSNIKFIVYYELPPYLFTIVTIFYLHSHRIQLGCSATPLSLFHHYASPFYHFHSSLYQSYPCLLFKCTQHSESPTHSQSSTIQSPYSTQQSHSFECCYLNFHYQRYSIICQ